MGSAAARNASSKRHAVIGLPRLTASE